MMTQEKSRSITADDLLKGLVDTSRSPHFPNFQIKGITSDSKKVKPGDLFIAQKGLTNHAIDFVAEAVKDGARAVIYDTDDLHARQEIPLLKKKVDIHWVAVYNLKELTGKIASRFYGYPSNHFRLIGITGTDGKTSVAHLLVQALMRLDAKVGSIGTLGYGLNNQNTLTPFTTPDSVSLQSILSELHDEGCEYVVMEVSSHALEQHRTSGCFFDIAVLTNLGSDHLDYHGSVENYAEAKSALFDEPNLMASVFNSKDAFGRKLAKSHKGKNCTTYSSDINDEYEKGVKLKSSCITESGLQITVSSVLGEITIQSGLIGQFNIDNCLACISVLILLGFDEQQIEQAMYHIQPVPGRMEYFSPLKNQPAVVIDFAHTEQALKACLLAVKNYKVGKLYCIFGCGGDRDRSKRPKMGAIAEKYADHVFLTDDNPRSESGNKIIKEILQGFTNPERVELIQDRQSAIETVLAQANENDLVVIAGKGHEQFQLIGDKRLPFSDQQVVRQFRKGGTK